MPLWWVLIPLLCAAVIVVVLAWRRSRRSSPTPAELGDLLAKAYEKYPTDEE